MMLPIKWRARPRLRHIRPQKTKPWLNPSHAVHGDGVNAERIYPARAKASHEARGATAQIFEAQHAQGL
eukprot:9353338-Alexandrium_andersonii.AAC.1